MHAFLAGSTLALAAQLAQGNPYVQTAADQDQTNPPAASAPGEAVSGEVAAATGPADATPLSGAQFQPPKGIEPELAPQRSLLVNSAKPSELMKSVLEPPPGAQLTGAPITLGEAVRDARSRQDQTQRAQAYWDLSAAVADYYLALLEATELEVLRQGITAPHKQWDVRQREAQTRTEAAHRSAQTAQLRLHQRLGRSITISLPLPADAPHCGRYNAEYEEIFASRPDPVAKQLAELLPLRHSELRASAQAIAEAVEWRAEVSERRSQTSDGIELLQAQDLLSLKRRAFVATARDYNREIAAYTELAAPAQVATDRLVAMMIRTSAPAGRAPWTPSRVEPATAEEPVQPDGAPLKPQASADADQKAGGQRTFADENVRQVRRPLGRLLNLDREHSIVRRIRRLRERD
jgi:hypothetical protein